MENTNVTETISQTINSLFDSLYSSIDSSAYATLDDITFISKDILYDSFTSELFGTPTTVGLTMVANALIIGFAIYYATRFLISCFTESRVEKPYQFIFKLLIVSLCVNFSVFFVEQFILINSFISGSIREVGEHVLNTSICFEQLIIRINSNIMINGKVNVFSFDGMIKSFTSLGLFGLLFTYALRYIMVKVFVLMTPIVTATLINNSTSWIFKSWLKSVFSLLIVQSFISIILLVVFSIDFSQNDTFTKLLYIGSIYALTKGNMLLRQIIGGISTDVSVGVSGIKNMIR